MSADADWGGWDGDRPDTAADREYIDWLEAGRPE